MYDFVDRRVERLGNLARLLLWAMRGWADASAGGICPRLALHRGFASVGALPALAPFHDAMLHVNAQARETIAVAPMHCQTIAGGEAVLLTLWRDAALGRTENLRATLALLLTETAAAPAQCAITATTALLEAAGFDLHDLAPQTLKETK